MHLNTAMLHCALLAMPQALQEETAERPVAGNQLVAVLRQLQAMSKR